MHQAAEDFIMRLQPPPPLGTHLGDVCQALVPIWLESRKLVNRACEVALSANFEGETLDGTLDYLGFLGKTHAVLRDWKTSSNPGLYGIPFIESAIQPMFYAYLVMANYPAVSSIQIEWCYTRTWKEGASSNRSRRVVDAMMLRDDVMVAFEQVVAPCIRRIVELRDLKLHPLRLDKRPDSCSVYRGTAEDVARGRGGCFYQRWCRDVTERDRAKERYRVKTNR